MTSIYIESFRRFPRRQYFEVVSSIHVEPIDDRHGKLRAKDKLDQVARRRYETCGMNRHCADELRGIDTRQTNGTAQNTVTFRSFGSAV
jgi:hypothetical protein